MPLTGDQVFKHMILWGRGGGVAIHIIKIVLGDTITASCGVEVFIVKLLKSGLYGVSTDYNSSEYYWS